MKVNGDMSRYYSQLAQELEAGTTADGPLQIVPRSKGYRRSKAKQAAKDWKSCG